MSLLLVTSCNKIRWRLENENALNQPFFTNVRCWTFNSSMPVTHADLKTVVEFKHIRKMGISYIKSSKSRSPRRAGGILAQGRSLVNRASSLSSSRCHGLHCPGEPAAIWPNLRAWSTGSPHLHLQSAMLPPMALFWGGEILRSHSSPGARLG